MLKFEQGFVVEGFIQYLKFFRIEYFLVIARTLIMLSELNLGNDLWMNNELSHRKKEESVSLQHQNRFNLVDYICVIQLMLFTQVFVNMVPFNQIAW